MDLLIWWLVAAWRPCRVWLARNIKKLSAVRHLLCLSNAFVKSDRRSLSLAQTNLKSTGGRKVQHQGEHGRAIGQEALQLDFHSQGYLVGSKPNL